MSSPGAGRALHVRPRFLVLAFLGGAAGTAARAGLGLAMGTGRSAESVLVANLAGALVLGFLLQSLALLSADTGVPRDLRILLGTGFCGGFTTYSALAVGALGLFSASSWPVGLAYTVGSVIGGVLAAWAGIKAAEAVFGRRRDTGDGRDTGDRS